MFQEISEYVKLPLARRQAHLRLDEPCIEIGGYDSREYRGLLAHFLNTTIPTGLRKINLCHRCNNHWCSNPRHIYWGTMAENFHDALEAGREPIDKLLKRKLDAMTPQTKKSWLQNRSSNAGKAGGGSNKLSEDEISRRKELIMSAGFPKRGWLSKASKELCLTHTQVKRFSEKFIAY